MISFVMHAEQCMSGAGKEKRGVMVKQLGESKGTVYGRKIHHFSGLHSVFPKTKLYCNARGYRTFPRRPTSKIDSSMDIQSILDLIGLKEQA
jgi:hypothetical protein